MIENEIKAKYGTSLTEAQPSDLDGTNALAWLVELARERSSFENITEASEWLEYQKLAKEFSSEPGSYTHPIPRPLSPADRRQRAVTWLWACRAYDVSMLVTTLLNAVERRDPTIFYQIAQRIERAKTNEPLTGLIDSGAVKLFRLARDEAFRQREHSIADLQRITNSSPRKTARLAKIVGLKTRQRGRPRRTQK